jgi:hypothetical protein
MRDKKGSTGSKVGGEKKTGKSVSNKKVDRTKK